MIPVPHQPFAGTRVLVTGAASGIGLATSRAFLNLGARVAMADRAEDRLTEAVAALGAGAQALPLDVTVEGDWERAMAALRAQWGGLDVLVANAGISHGGALETLALADWRRVMAVNLDGAFLALKHSLASMEAGAAIVVVTSASGLKAAPGAAAYSASKAALSHLVRCAALELAPRGIRINAVAPAGVATPMWEEMPFFQNLALEKGGTDAAFEALATALPLKRFATADQVAASILHLCSADAACITGTELVMDSGYTL